MKTKILIALLFAVKIVFTQSIDHSVIASSGDSYKNSIVIMDWTMGDIVTETIIGSNYILTQGFQQSSIAISALDENAKDMNVIVFPNPTSQYIKVEMIKKDSEYVLSLFDINGRLLLAKEQNKEDDSTIIDLSMFEEGTYLLKISNSKKVSTFKIIKVK